MSFHTGGPNRKSYRNCLLQLPLQLEVDWNLVLMIPSLFYCISSEASPDIVETALKMSGSTNFLTAGALSGIFLATRMELKRAGG